MRISIVVVSWNTCELTRSCVRTAREALEKSGAALGESAELIVVDNGSHDDTVKALHLHEPAVHVIERGHNGGFAVGANAGVAVSRGEIVLLLNTDAQICAQALETCLQAFADEPNVGIVGPQLVDESGRPRRSVHALPSLFTELVPAFLREILRPGAHPSRRSLARRTGGVVPVEAVIGASLFARRSVLDVLGGFCEDYFFYLEETDLCLRAREAGWRVIFLPGARVIHASGASSKAIAPARSRIEFAQSLDLFLRRHRGEVVAGVSRTVRALRAGSGWVVASLLAPFDSARPDRRDARRALWLWHVRGRPAGAGLQGWTTGTGRDEVGAGAGSALGTHEEIG